MFTPDRLPDYIKFERTAKEFALDPALRSVTAESVTMSTGRPVRVECKNASPKRYANGTSRLRCRRPAQRETILRAASTGSTSSTSSRLA
jgi:hypothetical protein